MALFPSPYYAIIEQSENSILLETSRPDSENQRSYLFVDPIEILTAETFDQIPALFQKIDECLQKGWYVAGFMSYECGYWFETAFGESLPRRSAFPLAWFGVYERPLIFHHPSGEFEPGPALQHCNLLHSAVRMRSCRVSGCRLAMSRAEYCPRIGRIRDYIAAGDSYQVNLTSKVRFDFSGSAAALFAQLRDRQKVPYAAFVHCDKWSVLSLSPELFFRISNGRITTRPMKGTAPRGRTLAEDLRLQAWLREDPKNRSENVMIVDLLRNDLGRIAEIGSIRVDDLFVTERYETLLQMTSTVSGVLRKGTSLYEIFRAMFPSGSVTGAPKVRSMQIIQELEPEPRGVYTGALGFFAPNGDATFNVAIRTIVLNGNSGEMGVGSGVVFDSVPSQEYEECLLKAGFLTRSEPSFELLESLLWNGSYHFLDLHLERLKSSAEYFGFVFEEGTVRSALEQNASRLEVGSTRKVRLLLRGDGTVRIENRLIPPPLSKGTVVLSPHRVSSLDRFLYHKTTHRELYEALYAEAANEGHEDVLFVNERGEITEGTRNNIFLEVGGFLATPPVECGLLPGVLRRHILNTEPRAVELVVSMDVLKSADAIYLCNSVKGLRRVTLTDQAPSRSLSRTAVADLLPTI